MDMVIIIVELLVVLSVVLASSMMQSAGGIAWLVSVAATLIASNILYPLCWPSVSRLQPAQSCSSVLFPADSGSTQKFAVGGPGLHARPGNVVDVFGVRVWPVGPRLADARDTGRSEQQLS